jgi:hypothetical protein
MLEKQALHKVGTLLLEPYLQSILLFFFFFFFLMRLGFSLNSEHWLLRLVLYCLSHTSSSAVVILEMEESGELFAHVDLKLRSSRSQPSKLLGLQV